MSKLIRTDEIFKAHCIHEPQDYLVIDKHLNSTGAFAFAIYSVAEGTMHHVAITEDQLIEMDVIIHEQVKLIKKRKITDLIGGE